MKGSKNSANTERINVSVPKELVALMRKEKGVNWSKVASEAFRKELSKPIKMLGTDCVP